MPTENNPFFRNCDDAGRLLLANVFKERSVHGPIDRVDEREHHEGKRHDDERHSGVGRAERSNQGRSKQPEGDDHGVMVQNALLACSAMGLAAVPRAWFEPQTVLQALGLTSYDPQMAVTVGFPK